MRYYVTFCLIVTLCFLNGANGVSAQNMAALTDEIEPKVVELRKLSFLKDVEKAFQSSEELQQLLLKEIERTYPGETLQALEKRLLKFGFVVTPIDLQQMITKLLSQEIAGYYDPRRKKMVLIKGVMGSGNQGSVFPIEYFSEFLAESMGVSLERVLLSHELTHVLQDQHFDLLSLPFEALDPEDTTSAVRALIEGDATLVMFDYILEQQGTDSTQVPDLASSLYEWADSPLVRGFGVFQPIPRYIVDNLLFSYIYGFDFVLRLKQQGGWERVNQAYRDFPVSTEQILHPEKYLEERDDPVRITLPTLSEDWRELERNTLGELNISILIDGYLQTAQAQLASAGWDGDRFALYENRDTGQLLLAWYTTWDTQQDAREFFQMYTAVLKKRYKDPLPANTENLAKVPNLRKVSWKTDDGATYMEIRGTDVLILDGVPERQLHEMISMFWKSQKAEGTRE